MMPAYYTEARPAYTGENNYRIVVTIDGTSDLTGWTFAGKLYRPDGTEVAGALSAALTSIPLRQATITIAGQTTEGEYRWEIHRIDDSSNFVVALGAIEIMSPVAFNHWQQVRQRVAECLSVAVADLPTQFVGLCSRGFRDAEAELRRIFVLKGYPASWMETWDNRQTYTEMLGAFYAITRNTVLSGYNRDGLRDLDIRKELKESAALVIGGVATAPPGNGEVGTIMYGTSAVQAEILADAAARGIFPE
jgi:hypothetical protein